MDDQCSLTRRRREAEIMDSPVLESDRHFRALRGLSRLNLLSNTGRSFWRPISRLVKNRQATRLSILDLATGGGDIPLALWRRARRANLSVDLHGVDVSHQALRYARGRAEAAGAEITFTQLDVLRQPLPASFDVVTCSLFLHHLDEPQVHRLLTAMRRTARRLLVVRDLVRDRRALWMTELAVRLLTRSDVVRVDGPRSVRAAFSMAEACRLAHDADLRDARIVRSWPCHFLLTWNKPQGN